MQPLRRDITSCDLSRIYRHFFLSRRECGHSPAHRQGHVAGRNFGLPRIADVVFAAINFNALDRPQNVRIRLEATVVAVRHDGAPDTASSVDVTYAVGRELATVRAKAVIVAAGGWIARHIVRDLPPSYVAAYAQFHHAPSPNSVQPRRIGLTASFYVGFPTRQADFELQIRKRLQQMLGGAGFDAKRDIAGIVFNRWGHAYIAPQPGFYFGTPGNPAPLEVIRERYGRIAFGHSELSGRQSWGRAAQESRRALKQVLEVI